MMFKSIAYLLLGATAGAIVGVLFAPKTGKESREELKNWLDEKREKSETAIEEFRKQLPEHKERILQAGRKVFKRNDNMKVAETVEA